MKKIIRNNRIIALAFFTVFTSLTATLAMGNDSNRVNHTIPVEMKFIGKIKEQPLFELSFAGSLAQNDFTITIRDEFNEVLYRENIRGEVFSKKFLINTDELGDATLFFEISCKKTKNVAVYQVNRFTKWEDHIVVSQSK